MTGRAGRTWRAALVALMAAILGVELAADNRATMQESTCVDCHSRVDGSAKEVVALTKASSHAAIGCQGCHGGDPASDDDARAHSGTWVGKPDGAGLLNMCGVCHTEQLAQFKTSKHAVEKKNVPRPNCASCHGVHTIGSFPESFNLAVYCAGCHGLEYLPALPAEFQSMLALVDDLHEGYRRAIPNTKMTKDIQSPEIRELRKALRTQVAAIVHPTERKLGLERIPEILRKGDGLKSLLKGQTR